MHTETERRVRPGTRCQLTVSVRATLFCVVMPFSLSYLETKASSLLNLRSEFILNDHSLQYYTPQLQRVLCDVGAVRCTRSDNSGSKAALKLSSENELA